MVSHIGQNIRRLRIEQNLTIEKLANMVGSHKGYIWKLENKTPDNPSSQKLKAIADVLNVSVTYLMAENPGEPDREQDAFYWEKYKKFDPKTRQKVRQFIDMMG